MIHSSFQVIVIRLSWFCFKGLIAGTARKDRDCPWARYHGKIPAIWVIRYRRDAGPRNPVTGNTEQPSERVDIAFLRLAFHRAGDAGKISQ
ncbi:MAG: hypothetical protein ACUVQG_00705 [Thermogutta sp.]